MEYTDRAVEKMEPKVERVIAVEEHVRQIDRQFAEFRQRYDLDRRDDRSILEEVVKEIRKAVR